MEACGRSSELLAVCLWLGGWLCALASTILPHWLSMSTELLAIESYQLGLWETCVVQDIGGMECRSYDSLLGLAHDMKLGRVLMCASLATGMLGLLVTIPGMQMVNSCRDGDGGGGGSGGGQAKRTLVMLGGVLAVLSGILCLIPVSYVAHLAVLRFFDEALPDVVPRWEFGDALFCGWAAGFLLCAAGVLLLVTAALGSASRRRPRPQYRYEVRGGELTAAKRSEYV
ncbi:putative claudin-24 [Gadus chalcogrammus]|uniref:putative claudin-24 n=1 Tax=Gadus chalcogrammus TaxID=1042646 RepID=UPI0024C47F51|nr:putative claudin-24 [Gadus chalcogrammus]